MTSVGGSSLAYDLNGNVITDEAGRKLTYDAWNRLVQVTATNCSCCCCNTTTVVAAYSYDALGRRIKETHGSTTTDLYYSNQWQVLEQMQGSAVTADNVWSPVYVDALVLVKQIPSCGPTQMLYVQQDANWNVTAVVNAAGVQQRFVYTPFGVQTVLQANFTSSGSLAIMAYASQGLRLDSAIGDYENRDRVKDPVLERFLQGDPAKADVSTYRVEGDNPTNEMDPTGLIQWNIIPVFPDLNGWINGAIVDIAGSNRIPPREAKEVEFPPGFVKFGGKEIGGLQVRIESGLTGDSEIRVYFLGKDHETKWIEDTLKKVLNQENAHLNWYQVVVKDTNPPLDDEGKPLKVPFVDPPPGGYAPSGGQPRRWADKLPWYYQEEMSVELGKPHVLSHIKKMASQMSPGSLSFGDSPHGSFTGNQKISFKTWLVLVNDKGALLDWGPGFSWDWEQEQPCNLGFGVVKNVKPLTEKPTKAEYDNIIGGFDKELKP